MTPIRPSALLFLLPFLPTFPLALAELDKDSWEDRPEMCPNKRRMIVMFNTIKAAKQVGFRERKDWEYGGEEITVKGRLLVRNPKEALSQTEWSKRGYRVRRDAQPHSYRYGFTGQRRVTYDVYRD